MTASKPTTISKKSRRKPFSRITIVLPVGSKMPTIRGKWKRLPDGQIRATYTPAEHAECLKIFELIGDASART